MPMGEKESGGHAVLRRRWRWSHGGVVVRKCQKVKQSLNPGNVKPEKPKLGISMQNWLIISIRSNCSWSWSVWSHSKGGRVSGPWQALWVFHISPYFLLRQAVRVKSIGSGFVGIRSSWPVNCLASPVPKPKTGILNPLHGDASTMLEVLGLSQYFSSKSRPRLPRGSMSCARTAPDWQSCSTHRDVVHTFCRGQIPVLLESWRWNRAFEMMTTASPFNTHGIVDSPAFRHSLPQGIRLQWWHRNQGQAASPRSASYQSHIHHYNTSCPNCWHWLELPWTMEDSSMTSRKMFFSRAPPPVASPPQVRPLLLRLRSSLPLRSSSDLNHVAKESWRFAPHHQCWLMLRTLWTLLRRLLQSAPHVRLVREGLREPVRLLLRSSWLQRRREEDASHPRQSPRDAW